MSRWGRSRTRFRVARLGRVFRGRGAWVTWAVVLGVVAAMGATVFGLGAADHALATSNASLWLWSSPRGEVARVNGETGRVDTRYKVADAQGHLVQIAQTDRYLVLRDPQTGKVSSLDLSSLQIAATSQSTPGLGVTVVLGGDAGFIIDAVQGVVRQLDPLTLTPTGDPLRFPPGLSGGAFDASGTLWLLVPTEGTVVGVRPATAHSSGAPVAGGKGGATGGDTAGGGTAGGGSAAPGGAGAATVASATGPRVERTVPVADPGHDLTMSALDNGVAVFDQTADRLTTVRGATTRTLAVPVSGTGTLPETTGGDGASVPVTVQDQRHVYVVSDGHVADFTVPGQGALSPAVPFAGRFYVADDAGTVYELDSSGRLADTIAIPHPGGPLQLQVRSGHLFINAPNSSSARVVDDQHRVKSVDKFANRVVGGDPPPSPTPPPSAPPHPHPHPTKPAASPPGAPTRVVAVAADASAHVSWGAAAANGSPVTKYVVEGAGAPRTVGARQRSLDVQGLVNGQQYVFSVYAVNAKGPGPKRAANPVVPTADVPDPPATVTAKESKDGSVTVSWPAANGQGRKITGYSVTTVTSGDPVDPVTTKTTTLTIPPDTLTYGTQYAFTVTAINDKGASSQPSKPSNTVVPYTIPGAPAGLSARTVDAKGTISVSWQAAADHGRPVTAYEVRAGATTQQVAATTTTLALTGLGDGVAVQVRVTALNDAGPGPAATASARTIAKPTITAGSASASGYNAIKIPFTVNGNGGATSCTVRLNGGASNGISCSGGSVGGLRPATKYSFVVTASNKAGSATITGAVTTPTVTGTVVCTDSSYCGSASHSGVGVYKVPKQVDSDAVASVYGGDVEQVQCWTTGDTVNAKPWGGKQTNQWLRVPVKGNNYIPYAWVNLDGGATIGNVPKC